MEALREMFPGRGEHALRTALQQAEGDVSAAAELLIPPSAQMARDEALARSLQAAEMPPRGAGMGTGAGADQSWGAIAQPIIDGLSAAADAAKGLVQYVAAEIAAAVDAEPEDAPRRTGVGASADASMRDDRNHDEAAVVSGGASRGETGTTMRTRAGRAAAAAVGGRSAPKKDD